MKLYERTKESQLLRLKNLVSIVNSNVNERWKFINLRSENYWNLMCKLLKH